MAKGRMVSRKIATDIKFHKLSIESGYLYVLTLPWLDRDGIIEADPWILLGKVAPRRIADLADQARQLIQEWIQQGLVTQYDGPDGPLLFFRGFRKNNSTMEYSKEEASTFPPPPGFFRSPEGLIPNDTEQATSLAESFYPTSTYGQALRYYGEHGKLPTKPKRAPAKSENSRTERPVESKSRETLRETEQEEEVYGGVGGVHTYSPALPVYGNGGDARGGDSPNPADPRNDYPAGKQPMPPASFTADLAQAYLTPAEVYIDAIIQLGQELNVWDEWNDDWRGQLDTLDTDGLVIMLTWLWKWAHSTPEQMEAIDSMPGLLKHYLKQHKRAGLRPQQFHEMLVYAQIVEEADQ